VCAYANEALELSIRPPEMMMSCADLNVLVATLITFCHGIALGWLSPMLPKLLSPQETPLSFYIDVNEASWLGAVISIGGISGNFSFSYLMNRFGRKVSIYALAVPHTVSFRELFRW